MQQSVANRLCRMHLAVFCCSLSLNTLPHVTGWTATQPSPDCTTGCHEGAVNCAHPTTSTVIYISEMLYHVLAPQLCVQLCKLMYSAAPALEWQRLHSAAAMSLLCSCVDRPVVGCILHLDAASFGVSCQQLLKRIALVAWQEWQQPAQPCSLV